MHSHAVAARSLPPAEAENLRAHLRHLMASRGWKQQEAAAALGVSQQALSSLLRGASASSFTFARAVARELAVEVGALLQSPPGKLQMADKYPNRAATLAFLGDEVTADVRDKLTGLDVGPADRPRSWWAARARVELDLAVSYSPGRAPDRAETTGIRKAAKAH